MCCCVPEKWHTFLTEQYTWCLKKTRSNAVEELSLSAWSTFALLIAPRHNSAPAGMSIWGFQASQKVGMTCQRDDYFAGDVGIHIARRAESRFMGRVHKAGRLTLFNYSSARTPAAGRGEGRVRSGSDDTLLYSYIHKPPEINHPLQ